MYECLFFGGSEDGHSKFKKSLPGVIVQNKERYQLYSYKDVLIKNHTLHVYGAEGIEPSDIFKEAKKVIRVFYLGGLFDGRKEHRFNGPLPKLIGTADPGGSVIINYKLKENATAILGNVAVYVDERLTKEEEQKKLDYLMKSIANGNK